MGQCAEKVNVLYLGRPVIKLESNPVREDRLRWQGSAEAIVPSFSGRTEQQEDEYSEQIEE